MLDAVWLVINKWINDNYTIIDSHHAAVILSRIGYANTISRRIRDLKQNQHTDASAIAIAHEAIGLIQKDNDFAIAFLPKNKGN